MDYGTKPNFAFRSVLKYVRKNEPEYYAEERQKYKIHQAELKRLRQEGLERLLDDNPNIIRGYN